MKGAKDRLSAVRQQIDRLIAARPGDRIALIVFADHAYLLSPDSGDRRLARSDPRARFRAGGTHHRPRRGHPAGAPAQGPDRSTALLLVTDGRNTAGSADPLREAKQAAAAGIRLYTLGWAPIRIPLPRR